MTSELEFDLVGGAFRRDVIEPATRTITVGAGQMYATPQLAAAALAKLMTQGVEVTANIIGHIDVGVASCLRWSNPFGYQVKWRGPNNLKRNLASVVSVVGAAGAWTVKVLLDDASGVAVDDFIKVANVLPGNQSYYTYIGKPVRGELRYARKALGELSSVGTAVTLTDPQVGPTVGDPPSPLWRCDSNDIAIAKCQPRRMRGVTAAGFTLGAGEAYDADIAVSPGLIGWWYVKNAGFQISTAGSSITVTAATPGYFQGRINPGDLIVVANRGVEQVTFVDPAGNYVEIAHAMNIPAMSYFGIVTPGETHQGVWKVTAVAGNEVTYTHTGGKRFKPPVANVVAGDITIIKSSIKGRGVSTEGSLDMDGIVVEDVGDGPYGFDLRGLRGSEPGKVGRLKLGPDMGVIGFTWSVYTGMGSDFFADGAAFTGGRKGGVYLLNGTTASMINATSNGHAGENAVRVGQGSFLQATGLCAMGSEEIGLWISSTGYALTEAASFWDNKTGGTRDVGAGGHFNVASRMCSNGYAGQATEAGGHGEARFSIALCNASFGYFMHGSDTDLAQAQTMGNGVGIEMKTGKHIGDQFSSGNNVTGEIVQNAFNTFQNTFVSIIPRV